MATSLFMLVLAVAEAILSFENCDPKHQAIETQLVAAITKQQQKHGSFMIVLAENLWPGGAQALKRS